MRKFLSIALALVLTFSLFGCSAPKEDVVILYTNDVHTYIDNPLSYDVLAGLKQALEAEYGQGNVLLVDAGDHIQGTAYGSMDKGSTITALMNAAGYDLATLGNHEFDYGMTGALAAVEAADFPYVSCNFRHTDGTTVLDAYRTFEVGGWEIAFVGITTPESFTKSTPAYFQDEAGNYIYDILGGEDGTALYTAVQSAIDAAAKEADLVIALGHLGDEQSSQPWTSVETIANTSGLATFIDGHSHSVVEGDVVMDKNGDPVVLTQTGEYFGSIGMMVIDGETGEISTELIGYNELTETGVNEKGEEVTEVVGYELNSLLFKDTPWPVDETVAALKTDWMSAVDTQLGAAIGSTALTFDNYDAAGSRLVRTMETNTGDFCADALYYLFDSMDMDVDVAIMNGGGVRNKAVTGELTYKTAKNIHTFGNVACLQTITGQQLLDALEWGARTAPNEECGGFLQVSGITYTIDGTKASSVQADDKGVWTGGPTDGYRVGNVKVYNKDTNTYEDLDLNATYNLAGYNYTLRDLGDGFNMFDGAVNVLDYVMEDYMVLANYIDGFDGDVDAANSPLLAKYPNLLLDYSTVYGSGRIMVAVE